jgi:Protease inhibitor Inh
MQQADPDRPYLRALCALVPVIALAAAVGGCSLDRFGVSDDTASATPTAAASAAAAPASQPRGGPPIEMSGRWLLASAGSHSCGMVFSSTVGALEGTVAPEGGCPGKLFMSRKWSFEQNALVLRNHNGEPLAQLSSAEPGRLEGRSISGEPVSLTR